MTKEEYIEKLNRLRQLHESNVKELELKYAMSNNSVNIGDIVSDGDTTILVDKLVLNRGYLNRPPYISYRGVRLTKQYRPFKSREVGCVFNVKKHIKKDEQRDSIA